MGHAHIDKQGTRWPQEETDRARNTQRIQNSTIPSNETRIRSPKRAETDDTYLWFARHDGDAVLTALQLLVADERAHVDRHLDAAILAMLHGHRAHRRPYN